MAFWKKKPIEQQHDRVEEVIDEDGFTVAVELEHSFVDLHINSAHIDVLELIHFYNELPSNKTAQKTAYNAIAIDYFLQYTHLPLGNAYDFFQTIVFYYYKHHQDPNCPFMQSDLTFAFSRVAIDLNNQISVEIDDLHLTLNALIQYKKYAFYLHEDNVQLGAFQFMKETMDIMPSMMPIEADGSMSMAQHLIQCELQEIAVDSLEDVRRFLQKHAYVTFDAYDHLHKLVELNHEIVTEKLPIEIMALKYIYVPHGDIQQFIQLSRTHKLQQTLVDGYRQYFASHEDAINTVLATQQFFNEQNEALYGKDLEVFATNQRYLNLFFDSYLFEEQLFDGKDSAKVKNCLKKLVTQYKRDKENDPHSKLKLSIIIKQAYYQHRLMANDVLM